MARGFESLFVFPMPRAPWPKAVAINVGVNNKEEWGGFRGSIFPDGRFHFIHVPWKNHYGKITPAPKKYSEMDYADFVPSRWKNKEVLVSPDFESKTYAGANSGRLGSADNPLRALFPGDYLFFYAALDFVGDVAKKKAWINERWGAYLVGVFKVKRVYPSFRHVLDDPEGVKDFGEYAWYKSFKARKFEDDNAPWVKGCEEGSGLKKQSRLVTPATLKSGAR